jgi:ribose/xylose/arabinose/galactoside ABC-type transport system permease subunit
MMSEQMITSLRSRVAELRLSSVIERNSRSFWTIVALILIIIGNRLVSPNFFSIHMVNGRLIGSPINILDGAASIMLLATGMTLVIATKGIDLSVGAVMAICAAAAVVCINRYERGSNNILYTPGFVILIAVGVGGLCGLWNGILIAFFDIQPIIATLILMIAGRGVAQMITEGQSPTYSNETLAFVGRGVIFGVPFPIYLSLAVLLAIHLLVRRTALGLMIESVGINARASYYAGINARLIKLLAYILTGMCAALAGLIVAGEIKSADPHTNGMWSELDAILAVVIGGTSLNGGRFNLTMSAFGVLITQSLLNALYVSKLHPTANLVVKAIVVLLVLLLQSQEFRRFIAQLVRRRA